MLNLPRRCNLRHEPLVGGRAAETSPAGSVFPPKKLWYNAHVAPSNVNVRQSRPANIGVCGPVQYPLQRPQGRTIHI